MPSRISLPKLSLFSSRHSSTPSTADSDSKMRPPPPPPTSAPRRASTLSPVSPPARLHLRNILPASPEEPPIMPPPPRTPRAWVWQCHQCHSVYRLGCTRRCLDCSHTYCVVSSKQQQSSSNRGKKRRRQQGVLCGAEFDYIGWEQWGSWKRKVQGYESTGRCDAAARDGAFLAKKHNCWIDCDSPSECGHRRYELAAEMLRNRMFIPDEAETEAEETQPPAIVADASPKCPDDDISLTEALVLSEAADGEDEAPLKSPLQSSFLLDDDEEEEDDEGNDNEIENEIEKTRKQEEDDEEEERWWAARTGHERDWATSTDEIDEDDGGGSKILTVRNITENDVIDDSDSSSESGESRWSSSSTLTDDSCLGVEAGTAIKVF